jgi:hypothetical protein
MSASSDVPLLRFTAEGQSRLEENGDIPLAIMLEGVSEKWQANILQILGRPTVAAVTVGGYGTIHAPAILLSQSQARTLQRKLCRSSDLNTHITV